MLVKWCNNYLKCLHDYLSILSILQIDFFFCKLRKSIYILKINGNHISYLRNYLRDLLLFYAYGRVFVGKALQIVVLYVST